MTVQEYAYAKLNLTLDVLAKRADGYHDMMMVMQTVSLSDAIGIYPSSSPDSASSVSLMPNCPLTSSLS